jgi:hypothetical protein
MTALETWSPAHTIQEPSDDKVHSLLMAIEYISELGGSTRAVYLHRPDPVVVAWMTANGAECTEFEQTRNLHAFRSLKLVVDGVEIKAFIPTGEKS